MAQQSPAAEETGAAAAKAAAGIVPVPGRAVSNTLEPSGNEAGWVTLAMRQQGDKPEFLLAKDSRQEWVPGDKVVF